MKRKQRASAFTLIELVVAALLAAPSLALAQTGPAFGVFRQLWTGLSATPGNVLGALTNTAYNPNWPDAPNAGYTGVLTNFETEVNTGMTLYGQRLRTFVVPPTNGAYTFWIASDDSSMLFLSSDETPGNKTSTCWVNNWTGLREWTKEANQQSGPINLEGGRRYYVEVLMQQGTGGDNLSVRWQMPGGIVEEPMTAVSAAGTRLIPYTGSNSLPGLFLWPANTIAIEGQNAMFSLLVTNQTSVFYQWRLNGTNIPGVAAAKPNYTVTNVTISQSGQTYACVLSNAAGAITSAPVTLTVRPDTVPPTVLRGFNLGTNLVQVLFSKLVEAASATNQANYAFTNGLAITGASLATSNNTVSLSTGPLVYGSNYTLVINGVRDGAFTPNTIATNTTASFVATVYASQDLGNPALPSVTTNLGNGLQVTAAGADLGGTSDQLSFNYQVRTGNFDVAVRIGGLITSDVWAKAGLMARETLDPAGRFAASLATPAMNGCFFEYRDPAASQAACLGNFPANYPATWLRLKRAGTTFTGFASYNGLTWSQLGSDIISMPGQIYLGLSLSSHSATQTGTAQFLDMMEVTNGVVGTALNPHEPLGPSSRKTPIIISEIMYKPAPRIDGNNVEFLELYNSNPWFQDISGYQLTCADMNYTFPAGTVLGGGSFLVVAASPASIAAVYGITNVLGPYSGSLKKTETLELLDEQGAVLLTVPYSNSSPWPVAPDGTGHSLVLANPTYGEEDPRAWDISDIVGGSPGQMDAFRPSPLRNLLINEFLANPVPPNNDYVELYNHANQAVDISGCVLTDDPNTNKLVIPPGTVIPARGFIYFTETNLSFALDAAGGNLYFENPDQTRILDAVHFDGQENGVATGRWPDGASDFYRMAANTPGAPNAAIRQSDVVINELMYDPITGNDDDQYIELYNRSTNSVSLGGWQLSDAVSFTFPAGQVLAPGGYLVVARNAARLRTNYANLNVANCLGDYSGKLSHNGEHLALTMPGTTMATNSQGVAVTNGIQITVNDLTYGTGGRWGQWAAGGGSSLELIDPNSNNRLAANWGESDETQKSAWTNIETTGVLDNGANYDSSIDYAQIGLLDVGEALVDNIEIRAGTNGTNLVLNPDFESGLGNWTLQGCLMRSSLENTGYSGSSHSLHLRCSDRIWTGVNSCEMALSANSLASGQTATLRFKARWLRGWPEALLRLNGNWLEATGPLPIPANLGTPGLPNSQYVTNAGPAIYQVTHTPAVPVANQPVLVTARVHDPNGIQSLTLYYRIDPGMTYNAVLMRDDGLVADAIAGDGIFSAVIPGFATNTVVAFYISARDAQSASTRFPALLNNNAPVPECVVMFGDSNPSGSFEVYHLWITQTNATRWSNLSDLSNESHDCTFVNNNRIIYNAQGRFAGSPYHQGFNTPYGNLCHYKWTFPEDDKFLGATSFNKIHDPGNNAGDDASLQREEIANTFLRALGVPWLYRHLIVLYVNGNRRGTLMEDAQTPDADMVKEYFPADKAGWLYKMQPWFEFGPAPTGISIPFANESWCNLMPYTTSGGAKKVARYRYNFEVRRTPVSANDFTNVFSLVDAAGSYGRPNYVASMENLADMENWMRVFAANHAAGNWDSFGAQNAQNLYGYMGASGTKYSLLMFDYNIVLGNSGSWSPGQNLFSVNSQDPNTANIYNEPTFRRMYWRALQELVNGPLNVANSGPLMDAKYNACIANGLTVENPSGAIKPWLTSAGTSIAAQIAAENTTNFTMNPGVIVSNNVALVSGTAPVVVKTIWFNGVEYPLTWTSVTGWRAIVPLHNGTNQFTVLGVDMHGQPIVGASNVAAVVYSGTLPSPSGRVVFNEIMYRPPISGAEFVEFYNNSPVFTFDLSGWQLPELGYTFPPGSLIGPDRFVVLAANRAAFATAYGAANPPFDVFPGTLQDDGQTLTLFQPGTNAAAGVVVAKVRFSSAAPWSPVAGTNGSSLQLIDPTQDNWRVGNWAAVLTNAPAPPQWHYVTLTGTAPKSVLLIGMHGTAGDVYLDDLALVAGSVAEAGPNLLTNGGFETPLTGPWTVSTNMTNSFISTAVKHSGNASLHVIATSPGDTISQAIWENTATLVTNGTYTLSYWYLPSTNGTQVLVRLSGSSPNSGQVYSLQSIQPPAVVQQSNVTPGATNSVLTNLTVFPSLWINELQADNLTGPTNSAGQRTAWLELFNPSTNTVSLNSLYLANNYTNLTQWAFPTNTVVNPGQFKVIFGDGQTGLSTTNEPHTSFTLPSLAGSLALSRLATNGQVQVLDYIDYTNLTPNHSYGSFPDGQSFARQEFFNATPGGTNDDTIVPSFIAYTVPGRVYTQDFNSLPNPGPTSVNTANPVTINGITYALANPFDFAAPVAASGTTGGLGLSEMVGWYGLAGASVKFGATDGDQTTGGQISFGLSDSTNRALGLLATSSTASTAFGVRFINATTSTFDHMNLQFTGQLWRQSDKAKTLAFHYLIEPTGKAPFSTNYTASLPSLNVAFPTAPDDVGGVAVDGTAPLNQSRLGATGQVITNWPPGAALWLVWEMADPGGKAQGLGIDDLSFFAWGGPGNTAPVLAPVADQVLLLGQTLSFTAQATDTDQPPQTLTFSLGSGTPAGATIDPATGFFTWTPADAPSTNLVMIVVSDNGIPSLSSVDAFAVRVLLPAPPPQLTVAGTGAGGLTFLWFGVQGRVYRVQYKDDLSAAAWNTLPPDQVGAGAPLSLSVSLANAPQRFYRVVVVQ